MDRLNSLTGVFTRTGGSSSELLPLHQQGFPRQVQQHSPPLTKSSESTFRSQGDGRRTEEAKVPSEQEAITPPYPTQEHTSASQPQSPLPSTILSVYPDSTRERAREHLLKEGTDNPSDVQLLETIKKNIYHWTPSSPAVIEKWKSTAPPPRINNPFTMEKDEETIMSWVEYREGSPSGYHEYKHGCCECCEVEVIRACGRLWDRVLDWEIPCCPDNHADTSDDEAQRLL